MADVPQRPRAPEKRQTLAEMAARAAQRSASVRPSAVDSAPSASSLTERSTGRPAPTENGNAAGGGPLLARAIAGAQGGKNGSGLIDLQRVAQAPSLAPATRSIAPSAPVQGQMDDAAPVELKGSRSRRYLVAGLFGILGIGVLYGVAAQHGMPSSRAAASLHAEAPTPNTEQPSTATVAADLHGADQAAKEPTTLPAGPTQGTQMGQGAAQALAPVTKAPIKANLRSADKVAAAPAAGPVAKAVEPVKAVDPAPAAPAPPALPAHAGPEPTGLAGAIRKAAGPVEQTTPQAVVTSAPAIRGDIPEVPGNGAIVGAIGAQRGAARACISDFDAPSRATLVFGSSGNVQSVSVSGPAAGTKAEACIKSALSKVAVGPFRKPTLSFSTTISPP